ncbi:hypothetical protein BJV74DRAFT_298032 [Russula compacta]|nr:hypothetical protein BJV74DRAFT_298032 [Russula compacta]
MDDGRTQDSAPSLPWDATGANPTWSTPAPSPSYASLPGFGTTPPSDFSSTPGSIPSLAQVNPAFVNLDDRTLHSTTPSAVSPKQTTHHISTLISKSPELLSSFENSRLDQAMSIMSRASTIVSSFCSCSID